VACYFTKSKRAPGKAPQLAAATARCEAETRWVVAEIAHQPRSKDQAALFVKFVAVAEACHRLRNFFSLFSIVCALGSPDVRRLKKVIKSVPDKVHLRLQALETLINPSRNMKVCLGGVCVGFFKNRKVNSFTMRG
jgi:hypothetical protein